MPPTIGNLAVRLVVLALLLSAGAFAQKVMVEYDHDVDVTKLRRYDWKDHPFLKTHPESQRYTIGMQLVQSQMNEILMGRGYTPNELNPEFHIALFITARLGQETRTIAAPDLYPGAYMWPGSWYTWSSAWFPAWDTYVENYVQGVLLIDVVDAKTNKLLWRAACKDKIDDMKERHTNIEDAVKKAMKKFPPKFKEK